MNNDINKYQQLLDKLKLSRPVPEKTQKYAIKSGDRNLKQILKKTGYYSAFFGMILALYRWMRFVGINATLLKGKILLSVITAGVVSSAVVLSPKIAERHIGYNQAPEISEQKGEANLPGNRALEKKPAPGSIGTDNPIGSAQIGIQAFSGDEEAGRIITSKMAANISESFGAGNVAFIARDKKVKLDRLLMGSVRTFGDTKYITARIINVKDSSVEHVFSEEYHTDSEMKNACRRISEKIAEKLKKKQ